jgi:galactokinase
MTDWSVTDDQGEFYKESQAVDWGVLVTVGINNDAHVHICAMNPESAARLLRDAADEIERQPRIQPQVKPR